MSAADRITELGNILETCAEGKESIAEALTSKGVPTEPEDSFDTMAVNVGLISGGGGGGWREVLNVTTSEEVSSFGGNVTFDINKKYRIFITAVKTSTNTKIFNVFVRFGTGTPLLNISGFAMMSTGATRTAIVSLEKTSGPVLCTYLTTNTELLVNPRAGFYCGGIQQGMGAFTIPAEMFNMASGINLSAQYTDCVFGVGSKLVVEESI